MRLPKRIFAYFQQLRFCEASLYRFNKFIVVNGVRTIIEANIFDNSGENINLEQMTKKVGIHCCKLSENKANNVGGFLNYRVTVRIKTTGAIPHVPATLPKGAVGCRNNFVKIC